MAGDLHACMALGLRKGAQDEAQETTGDLHACMATLVGSAM